MINEALEILARNYGKHVVSIVSEIVDRIEQNVMSVPLDKDPSKASLALYAERMKAEGAAAVKNAVIAKLDELKRGN